MADVVLTAAKQSPNPDFTAGNKKFRFRSLTTDTGNYVENGIPVTAETFGLKQFAALIPLGTAKTSDYELVWNPVVRYASDFQTAYLILGESAADGDPFDEKPVEACIATTTYCLAIGH